MSNNGNARPGFLAELRRRRVLRTLALYIVSAWVLMQFADVVFPALDIPERAIRYLLVAAIAGFPVALIFGWFFDITPQGVRRTQAASARDADAAIALRLPEYLLLAALAAVLGAVLYGTVGSVLDASPEPPDGATARQHSADTAAPLIAVLPFAHRGTDDDAALFAAGVHDDLLTRLSQLSGLRVVARSSVSIYENTAKSATLIARELGADAILEGVVQLAGGHIRINAQLVEAGTQQALWAETFDRELSPANLFSVQADIARSIAGSLDTTLSPDESDELDLVPTNDLGAYRAFHEAQEQIYRDRPRWDRGIELLEEALARDLDFTKAMLHLVYALSLSNFGGDDPEMVERVEALIERLGALAPNSIDYLIARAYYVYYIVRDFETADRLLAQARQRAPSDTRLLHIQSWVKKRKGDFDAWIDLTYLGRRLEPREDRWHSSLVYRLATAHRYDEALRVGEAVSDPNLTLQIRLSRLRLLRHQTLVQLREDLERIRDDNPDTTDFYPTKALVLSHIALREYDAAADALGAAVGAAVRDGDTLLDRVPQEREWTLLVQYLSGDADALAATLARTRRDLGLDGEDGPDRLENLFAADRFLLALVAGEAQRAREALDDLQRIIAGDIAPMLVLRPLHCRGLALLGDADNAVRCLRAGIERPSKVMPFFEPRLPFYDGIRESEAFQRLLTTLRSEGWLAASET